MENVASAQVDRTTGIKRRASSSPVHSSPVKKSWRGDIATKALGEAYTLSIDESNPMEIPDSQEDGEGADWGMGYVALKEGDEPSQGRVHQLAQQSHPTPRQGRFPAFLGCERRNADA